MFNKKDVRRDIVQLFGGQSKKGYDWWWHSFTAHNAKTGEEKSFFIEFFLCNPALAEDKPVFGQLKDSDKKPSYLMIKAGTWGKDAAQVHRFFSWKECKISFGCPFEISADDCFLNENEIRGRVCVSKQDAENHREYMCESGEMIFNLKIEKQIAFNVGYGASSIFRKLQLFEMFWHAQGMKTFFSGEVIWNGEKYNVTPENCYGYADKNWGKNFTSPWVWLSSNNLESAVTGKKLNDSVFDIGGGRPKIAFVPLKRKLLSAFWYEGKEFEFNFSKFWTGCKTKFHCEESESEIIWHVEQKTWTKKMIADVRCKKEDMLFINYESPDGKKLHNRLWNGGNGKGTVELYQNGKLVDRVKAENIGCEFGEYSDC